MNMFSWLRSDGNSLTTDYPEDWNRVSTEILKRDNYICQRCNHHSGPHAEDSGRILQSHHIIPKSEGGSDNGENLATLCLPCHGVQHPHNQNFDTYRNDAPVLPHPDADPDVAYVNSEPKEETIEEYLHRKGDSCARCWAHRDEADLFLYPTSLRVIDHGNHPAESYLPVCRSCLGTVAPNDQSMSIQELSYHLISYQDVHADIDVEEVLADADEPQLLSYHMHGKLLQKGHTDGSVKHTVLSNFVVMLFIAIITYELGKWAFRP